LKETIKLLRVCGSKVVDADLLDLSPKHLADFETFWKPRLQSSSEEDSHWNWVNKYLKSATPNYERYALECENITQGLILLELDCYRSRCESGRSLVYVDFLATAPWNRCSIQNPPSYKGVGMALVTYAVKRSFDLGYKGRLGLHALPLAEAFYAKLGMVDFGLDAGKENLKYFELPSDKAEEFIRRLNSQI
jgi:hypothetical protein